MPDIFDASANRQPAATPTETESHSAEPVVSQEAVGGTTSDTETREFHRLSRHVDDYSMVMRDEQPSNNPLRSFIPKPEKIFFDSQHVEEHVLLLLRRHPITQLRWIIIAIIMAIVPILFIDFLAFLPPNYQLAALTGWYLLLTGFALESFLTWFYNVFIITDERVIDVDFYNLLFKNISSAKIDNIEDVSSTAGGVLASIFNYGTVRVQTAGTATEFEFEDVPQPAKVTAFLNEMILEEEREKLEDRAT